MPCGVRRQGRFVRQGRAGARLRGRQRQGGRARQMHPRACLTAHVCLTSRVSSLISCQLRQVPLRPGRHSIMEPLRTPTVAHGSMAAWHALRAAAQVTGVRYAADGKEVVLEASLVVVGVGARPNVELFKGACARRICSTRGAWLAAAGNRWRCYHSSSSRLAMEGLEHMRTTWGHAHV